MAARRFDLVILGAGLAGLGGHGMGCSWEIGRLAADCLLGAPPPEAFEPGRFRARSPAG